MNLVTRCTACGTLFKVVADQLKISGGWVRCGQCAHVFDASANMVDAQPPLPAAASPTAGQIASAGSAAPFAHQAETATESIALGANSMPANSQKGLKNEASDSNGLVTDEAAAFEPGQLRDAAELERESGPSTTSWAVSDYAAQDARQDAPAQNFDSVALKTVGISAEPTTLGESVISVPAGQYSSSLLDDSLVSRPSFPSAELGSLDTPATIQPLPTPGFIKQAQRAARWRSPWVRLGLSVLALVLLAGLTLQIALREKDVLAATYPQAKPWLQILCDYAACRVEPPKRIDALVIDSSSFNRINKNNPQLEASAQSYRLAVTLKNTGTLAIAPPHVELSLQDTQDQTVLRRVLSPADLGAVLDTLAPSQEFAGSLTLQISTAQLAGSRINGYRVLAFYP
ncbi:MAG: DUF3426 domain-containing protein [Brachymonas sp.]|nr:DUF3426 domain-containing protein [Brachymonas sp.]